jgi:iron complex transport system substrate-binding protein
MAIIHMPLLVADEISYEQIAALNPDAIEAMWSGISEEQYAELSKIAPVVAAESRFTNWDTPWDVQALTIGRIVGQQENAEASVDQINQRFADVAAAHPEWQGLSVAVVSVGEQVEVYTSNHVISKMFGQLGFVIPEAVDAAAENGAFYVEFSPENLSAIDADIIVWFSVEDDASAIQNLVLRDRLVAHAEGREIFTGKVLSGAFSFASALSLGYVLDHLVPSARAAGLTD